MNFTGRGQWQKNQAIWKDSGGRNLSAKTLRVIGFLFLVVAAVVAVLNLKRVANLGLMWLSPPLLIVGLGFVAIAARRK